MTVLADGRRESAACTVTMELSLSPVREGGSKEFQRGSPKRHSLLPSTHDTHKDTTASRQRIRAV